jgi:hypothetical protein
MAYDEALANRIRELVGDEPGLASIRRIPRVSSPARRPV